MGDVGLANNITFDIFINAMDSYLHKVDKVP